MDARQSFKAAIIGILFLGCVGLGPAPASAANQWWQQALLLAHIPLGGGQFFTINYVLTATEGANTVNIKCFNDALQRIGPAAGVNIQASATGQSAQHTPTTLVVASDPLFASGIGWCWANNTNTQLDYNVLTTVGITSNLTPGGILNSPTSTFVAANTGLGETSSGKGGIPYFTTSGGAQNFLIVVNPLTTTQTLTFTLYDSTGFQQGSPLVRVFGGRALQVQSIPGAFGLATPPTTGSVSISTTGGGFLGWLIQAYPTGSRLIFTSIGLDGDDTSQLPQSSAP